MHTRGASVCILTPVTTCFASSAGRVHLKPGLNCKQQWKRKPVRLSCVVNGELPHNAVSQAGNVEQSSRLRQVGDVHSASRLRAEDDKICRAFGPAAQRDQGIGRLLALDEFFTNPGPGLSVGPNIPESVVYFLEPADPWERSVAGDSALEAPPDGHGMQLHLRSAFAVEPGSAQGGFPVPGIVHVRSRGDVPVATLAEGITVHVVAGACGDVAVPPPLDDFVFFDIKAGPSKDFCIPLPASYTAAVYILQGVGIFGPKGGRVSYENEGHLVMLPGEPGASRLEPSLLQVRTHPCDGLRCIIIAAEADVVPVRGGPALLELH